MEAHIACLVRACERLRLDFRFVDRNRNYVVVEDRLHFQLNKTPFNSESMSGLCKDKEHQYELLHESVRMPKTTGYLDFDVPASYRQYLTHGSIDAIVRSVTQIHDLPVVVKRNKGALGDNVFLCRSIDEIGPAFRSIFDKHSASYDYVALAQAYVRPRREVRVVCFEGEPLLAYERHRRSPGFGARYWESEGGKAIGLDPEGMGRDVARAFLPALELPGLDFVALDVIIDRNGDMHLIELNSAPQFNHFIRYNGSGAVESMYTRILERRLGNGDRETAGIPVASSTRDASRIVHRGEAGERT